MTAADRLFAEQRAFSAEGAGSRFFTLHLQSFIPRLITVMVVVFVFEETLYGRLGFGAVPYLIAKTLSEAVLYMVLLLVILQRLLQGDLLQYRPTLFDFCISIFLTVALVSTWINHGSLVLGLLNVRTMLRYLSIYYIIVLSEWAPTERQMMRLVRLLVGIAIVQTILITVQHIAGDAFRDRFFSPAQVEVVVYGMNKTLGVVETKIGSGYGTFGKTVLAAYYLLFVAVMAVAVAMSGQQRRRTCWWLVYVVILVGIYFTYKRAALLLMIAAPLMVAWYMNHKRFVIRYLALGMVAAPLLLTMLYMVKPEGYVKAKEESISPAESLAQLLSEEYWTIAATKSRGWMIMEVGKQALISFKPIGYGADEENAKSKLAVKGGEFAKLVGWGAFDDVYIVAGLVYYGPIGVGLLLAAFYDVFERGKRLVYLRQPNARLVGVSVSVLQVMTLLSVFISRVLEIRVFAFTFWVMAGITVVLSSRTERLHERVRPVEG